MISSKFTELEHRVVYVYIYINNLNEVHCLAYF